MQVNPYLFYNGNCEAALKYYQKVLGAKIEAMLTYEADPPRCRSRRTIKRSHARARSRSTAKC